MGNISFKEKVLQLNYLISKIEQVDY